MSDIIECRSLCFNYGDGDSETSILNHLNFKVETNEKKSPIVNNKLISKKIDLSIFFHH